MSIAHIVTLYSTPAAASVPPVEKLPIYRFAIGDATRGETMARACISALRKENSDFEFSHDVRAIQFVGAEMQTFELVADVMETEI
ncbi:hypothetical protein [Rhizobium wenxiniae]|uniref:hypothetical protein n=1 Tax=Rhizobium wenxiniae TaxID=1737357 RepID=UPI003C1F5DBA